MNRIDRLMATVVLLQSRRVVRAEDIARHFEISLRTVYRDVSALGEAGIPILAETGVGYSLMKGYHLPPVMFTAEEASALSLGGKLVAHLTDASLHRQMDTALMKIRSVLPRDHQDYLDRLERSTAVLRRSSGNIPRLASETLIPIQRAIAERRVLAIEYQSGQKQEITRREAEPLGLLYYSDSWHLIAYCRLRRDFRDFRSDRIRALQLLQERFEGHENFSLKDYLKSTMDRDNLPTAQIKFATASMNRVRREWSCGVVDECVDGDRTLVTVLTSSEERLTGWVLSFGTEAEVVSPASLRQLVRQKAEAIAEIYAVNRPQSEPGSSRVTRRRVLSAVVV